MLALLAFATPAQAHVVPAGQALEHHAGGLAMAEVTCPAAVPVQTITVQNEAAVRPWALAKVENAVVDQSLQLRAAWGTPCVRFAPGGWLLYLRGDSNPDAAGVHDYAGGAPFAIVWTSGQPWSSWSWAFSHEVIETLVDPTWTNIYYVRGQLPELVEPADPVYTRRYTLDGVPVSDFTFPAFYAGAITPPCTTTGDNVTTCAGPLIAPADAPGPYDEMGVVTAAWQPAGQFEPTVSRLGAKREAHAVQRRERTVSAKIVGHPDPTTRVDRQHIRNVANALRPVRS